MGDIFRVLSLVLAAVIALAFLLPILGVVLLVIAGAFALVIGGLLVAPFLARLPWFRNRIWVHRDGRRQTIRFGRGVYSSARRGESGQPSGRKRSDGVHEGQLSDDEVLDVEGREIKNDDD